MLLQTRLLSRWTLQYPFSKFAVYRKQIFAKYIYFPTLSQAPAWRQADRRVEPRSLPRLLHGAECDVLVLLPHQAPRALVEATTTTHGSFFTGGRRAARRRRQGRFWAPASGKLLNAGARVVSGRRRQESC